MRPLENHPRECSFDLQMDTGQVTQPRAPQAKRLQPFVAAAESLGFCVLWSEPGREADDMIGSLASGLVSEMSGVSICAGERSMQRERSSTIHQSPYYTIPPPGSSQVDQRHCQLAADGSSTHPPRLLPPRICICTGDSDMQQLLSLSDTVTWMELLAWPGGSATESEHPSAMTTQALEGMPWLAVRLHVNLADDGPDTQGTGSSPPVTGFSNCTAGASSSLASDQQLGGSGGEAAGGDERTKGGSSKSGLPPSAYPDYLALVGKPEAGVQGVGLSSAAAKTLLRKFDGIRGIQEAEQRGLVDGSSLRQVQKPAKADRGKEEPGGSSGCQPLRSSDKLVMAVRNLQATRICCDPETVPWDRVSAAVEMMGRLQNQTYPSRITQLLTMADVGGGASSGSELAILHPHNLWHALSAGPYVEAVSALLTSRAVAHEMWRVTGAGLLSDLVIPQAQPSDQGRASAEACRVMLLSPADFSTSATAGFPDAARLAVHLRGAIGPRSSPDHLPQKLKSCMTGIAQLRVKQLRREGGTSRLVIIPFYEVFHFEERGSSAGLYGLNLDLNHQIIASLS